LRERCHELETRLVDEHLVVPWRQAIATLIIGRFGVLGLQDAAHRLLFEPFPRVPLVDAASRCKLGGGEGGAARERPVEAEAIADVDAQEIQGSDRIRG
jgi:hypothetical protein